MLEESPVEDGTRISIFISKHSIYLDGNIYILQLGHHRTFSIFHFVDRSNNNNRPIFQIRPTLQ